MINQFEHLGQKLPYSLPAKDLDPLRERIRLATTARVERSAPRKNLYRAALAMAAIVALGVVTAVWFTGRSAQPAMSPDVEINQLLQTASNETLQQAAVRNYDDLLTNQQL